MAPFSIFAPAKLNLFLAVTGRRADGFHDLLSVVAPLDFGDVLCVEAAEADFSLQCDDASVPVDENNLVMKAARAFAARTGWRGGANFYLEKRIPMGAGLGGGSSDAVAALRALNELAGRPLDGAAMHDVAATLGSDCPLFLAARPVVMRGRGESLTTLPESAAVRLEGRRALLFKPAFGVPTPWAYARMAAQPETYLPATQAEARLAAWIADAAAPAEALLFNNMERAAFAKYLALPALLEEIERERMGLPRMSGSGSACFMLLPGDAPVDAWITRIRAAWGETAFVVEARIGDAAKNRQRRDINPH